MKANRIAIIALIILAAIQAELMVRRIDGLENQLNQRTVICEKYKEIAKRKLIVMDCFVEAYEKEN